MTPLPPLIESYMCDTHLINPGTHLIQPASHLIQPGTQPIQPATQPISDPRDSGPRKVHFLLDYLFNLEAKIKYIFFLHVSWRFEFLNPCLSKLRSLVWIIKLFPCTEYTTFCIHTLWLRNSKGEETDNVLTLSGGSVMGWRWQDSVSRKRSHWWSGKDLSGVNVFQNFYAKLKIYSQDYCWLEIDRVPARFSVHKKRFFFKLLFS